MPGAVSTVAEGVWLHGTDVLERWALERPRFGRGLGAADQPSAKPLSPADLAHLSGLYDGSVAWADAALGMFLGGLEERDLLDRVWLVVLSDHGHELGEHGSFHHRFALSDATLHVPLLIRPPGGLAAPRVVSELVDLIDIAPTLTAIAGASPPPRVRGQALWSGGDWQTPTRSESFAEGRLRLLSVRSETGTRLTAEGLSIDHPDLIPLLEAAPPGSPALRLEGAEAEAQALPHALVRWRNELAEVSP